MARSLLPSFLFALLLALLAPTTAHADANAEARVLFEEGNRRLASAMHQRGARRQAGLESALESYVASLRIVRSRNAIFNAGSTLQELGRADEAYDYYREYLALPDVAGQDRTDAEARVAAITPQLALVQVASTPPADVRVDRRDLAPRGTTPLTFAAPAGEHVVYLAAAGYREAELHFTGTVGQTATLHVQLDANPIAVHVLAPDGATVRIDGAAGDAANVAPGVHVARVERAGVAATERRFEVRAGDPPLTIDLSAGVPAAPGQGTLVVAANVDSRIIVDGRAVATARTTTLQLPSGSHPLRVESVGRLPYDGMLDVREDGTTHAVIALGRDPTTVRHMGAWPWVSLIATGLIAVASVGATIGAFQAHDDYVTALDRATMSHLFVDQSLAYADAATSVTKNNSADALWVVTAVFAGLTLLLFLLDESDGPPTHGTVTLSASAGGMSGSAQW